MKVAMSVRTTFDEPEAQSVVLRRYHTTTIYTGMQITSQSAVLNAERCKESSNAEILEINMKGGERAAFDTRFLLLRPFLKRCDRNTLSQICNRLRLSPLGRKLDLLSRLVSHFATCGYVEDHVFDSIQSFMRLSESDWIVPEVIKITLQKNPNNATSVTSQPSSATLSSTSQIPNAATTRVSRLPISSSSRVNSPTASQLPRSFTSKTSSTSTSKPSFPTTGVGLLANSTLATPSMKFSEVNWHVCPHYTIISCLVGQQSRLRSFSLNFTLTAPQLTMLKTCPDTRVLFMMAPLDACIFSTAPLSSRKCYAFLEMSGLTMLQADGKDVTELTPQSRSSSRKSNTTQPFDITKYVLQDANVSKLNHVVGVALRLHREMVMVVALARRQSVDQLVLLSKTRVLKAEDRIGQIQIANLIGNCNSDDIQTGKIHVSLRDPLSYARIVTPLRSRHCRHPECFDAATFLKMNEQTPKYTCPICHLELGVTTSFLPTHSKASTIAYRAEMQRRSTSLSTLVGFDPLEELLFDEHFAAVLETMGAQEEYATLLEDGKWIKSIYHSRSSNSAMAPLVYEIKDDDAISLTSGLSSDNPLVVLQSDIEEDDAVIDLTVDSDEEPHQDQLTRTPSSSLLMGSIVPSITQETATDGVWLAYTETHVYDSSTNDTLPITCKDLSTVIENLPEEIFTFTSTPTISAIAPVTTLCPLLLSEISSAPLIDCSNIQPPRLPLLSSVPPSCVLADNTLSLTFAPLLEASKLELSQSTTHSLPNSTTAVVTLPESQNWTRLLTSTPFHRSTEAQDTYFYQQSSLDISMTTTAFENNVFTSNKSPLQSHQASTQPLMFPQTPAVSLSLSSNDCITNNEKTMLTSRSFAPSASQNSPLPAFIPPTAFCYLSETDLSAANALMDVSRISMYYAANGAPSSRSDYIVDDKRMESQTSLTLPSSNTSLIDRRTEVLDTQSYLANLSEFWDSNSEIDSDIDYVLDESTGVQDSKRRKVLDPT